MSNIAILIPAFRLSIAELEKAITQLPKEFGPPLIVLNDEGRDVARYLRNLNESHNILLLHIPYQVGKAEALRQGLRLLLRESDPDIVVQVDGRSKQPVWQVTSLVEALHRERCDMVVGDRYTRQNMDGQDHRKAGAGLMTIIVKSLTGYELPDAVCGARAYVRELAMRFLNMRCFGYGVEVEQLLIAAIHSAKVSSLPLAASRQTDVTNAEKIEDSVFAVLSYANELEMPDSVRTTLSFVLAQIKRRQTFDIDLSVFGLTKSIRLKYIGSNVDIIDAYADQLPRDAYTASCP